MKKTLLFILALFTYSNSLFAETEQITSFDDLMIALRNGEEVRVVIYYAQCKLIIDDKEEEAPDAIGGMVITNFEHFAKGVVRNDLAYVSTSESVLIGHPFYGYVYNYVKLRIYEDNTVQITAQYLAVKTFEVKMDEIFKSEINDTVNEGGVYFFK